MNGLEISEVYLSELEEIATRLDAGYYRPSYLRLHRRLIQIPHSSISEFAYVTDGIHESIQYSDDSNIHLISAKVPKENYFDISNAGRIDKQQHLKNPRTELRVNDIIVSTVGTIGNCAVVDESILPANSDRHVGIIRIQKNFQPRFLSTFLLSKYGRFQTLRESTGNVQLNLFIYKINEIIVPRLSEAFQYLIEKAVQKASFLLQASKGHYIQAEQYLLSELGLADWQPTHQPAFVRNFSDFLQADRLDAEYFQPKYQTIIEYFSNSHSIERIRQWGKVLKGRSVQYLDEGKGIPVIRSGDLIDLDDEENFKQAIPEQQFFYLQKGDICISSIGFGSIGKIQVFDKNGQYATVSEVTVIRQQRVNPYYLQLFLQSVAGQLQIERWITGATGQLHLYPRDVEKIIVPILLQEKQKEFERIVMKSRQTKKRANHLLEIAKRGVELAIEQDEKAAEAWIQEQVKQLGIEIDTDTLNSLSKLHIDKTAFSVTSLSEEPDDKAYWWSRTPEERLRHIETLRRINYGDQATARLQRVLEIAQRAKH